MVGIISSFGCLNLSSKNQAKNPIHFIKIYCYIRCTCWIRWTCSNNLNHRKKHIFLVSIYIYLVSQRINIVSETCKSNSVRTEKCSEPIQTSNERKPYISEHIRPFSEPKTQNNSTGISNKLSKLQKDITIRNIAYSMRLSKDFYLMLRYMASIPWR